jgi:hypothetical protein
MSLGMTFSGEAAKNHPTSTSFVAIPNSQNLGVDTTACRSKIRDANRF